VHSHGLSNFIFGRKYQENTIAVLFYGLLLLSEMFLYSTNITVVVSYLSFMKSVLQFPDVC